MAVGKSTCMQLFSHHLVRSLDCNQVNFRTFSMLTATAAAAAAVAIIVVCEKMKFVKSRNKSPHSVIHNGM